MSALPMPEHAQHLTSAAPSPEDAPRPGAGRSQRTRTPLALVPARATARRKAPFVIMCLVIVAAVVGAVLMMNVQVARTQYQLVALQGQQEDLTQSNQSLTAELNYRKAPQNLAAAATKLKMVPAGQPGTLDLAKHKVSGTATAAQAGTADENTTLLSRPLSPAQQEAKTAARHGAVSTGKDASSATSAAASGAASAEAAAKKADSKKSADSIDARSKFSSKTLNGGTIPAPQTR